MPRVFYKPQSLLEEVLQTTNSKWITNCLFVLFLSSSIVLCTITKVFSDNSYNGKSKNWWQQRRELELQREKHLQEYEQQSDLRDLTKYSSASNTDHKMENNREMPTISQQQQQQERRRQRRAAFIPPEFPAEDK